MSCVAFVKTNILYLYMVLLESCFTVTKMAIIEKIIKKQSCSTSIKNTVLFTILCRTTQKFLLLSHIVFADINIFTTHILIQNTMKFLNIMLLNGNTGSPKCFITPTCDTVAFFSLSCIISIFSLIVSFFLLNVMAIYYYKVTVTKLKFMRTQQNEEKCS